MPTIIRTGRIANIDRSTRSFTIISDANPSTIMRFNMADHALIIGPFGMIVHFSFLRPGMLVRVRHARFTTASIPPQTTAFEVRVLH